MNKLANATSPYLLQHADNPVSWYEWGEPALNAAREQDKPILLSIGYSACHWCHVMAHESFEDESTAAVMNKLFINVKVDREERPDLDKIYQLAHQALTRRGGGWPLTMFLAPDDQLPFFGGTYFPPMARHGLPSFVDLLHRVAEAWDQRRDALREQNGSMREFLDSVAGNRPGEPDPAVAAEAVAGAAQQFDFDHGGLGSAPKFPNPPILRLLLRRAEVGDNQAHDMALKTLRKMSLGGINDQLAGGFCRYSVDRFWMIPHFEKMLYDNAQLLALYAEAAVIDDDPLWRDTALATGHWMLRELQSPDGGLWSSYDADSEGEEGRYYVWQKAQLRTLLSDDEFELAAALWGLEQPPNFEGQDWHLHCYQSLDQAAEALSLPAAQAHDRLRQIKSKLTEARATRVPPGLDDKVLSSWNGLAIGGLARVGRLLGEAAFIDAAARASDFIAAVHWQDGRLLTTSKQGRAQLNGYLDDYAFMLVGTLELLQANWRETDLEFATALADALLAHFEDAEAGGFYFTSHDHEALIQRPKPIQDDAIPAGGAQAIEGLLTLGHLLAEPRYLAAADRAIRSAWGDIAKAPLGYCSVLAAAQDWFEPPSQLVIRGSWSQPTHDLRARQFVAAPGRSATLDRRYPPRGEFAAYHCLGTHCDAPIESAAALRAQLPKPNRG